SICSSDDEKNRREAEMAIRADGHDAAAAWLERQKSYRKILRTASFASVLFLISWFVVHRRPYVQLLVPLGAVVLFFAAYLVEENHYLRDLSKYHEKLKSDHAPTRPR